MQTVIGAIKVPSFRQPIYGEKVNVLAEISDDGSGNQRVWVSLEGQRPMFSQPHPQTDEAILRMASKHMNDCEWAILGPDEEYHGEHWTPEEIRAAQ